MRNQDKTKTCSEDDSVQGNVQASGLSHNDRKLACIRWSGKAHVVEMRGFHGPIDSRPFRSVLPRHATKTHNTCYEVGSAQGNVQASGLVNSDRRLSCIRWRGKAQVVEKQGFHEPTDFRQFPTDTPWCATKTRLRSVSKFIQSKAVYKPRASCTLIGGLRAYGSVGRLKSLKRRPFTDPLIPGVFRQIPLGAQPR